MRFSNIFIVLAMVAALSVVSCKNKKSDIQAQEQTLTQKIEYGEEALAIIDSLANIWIQSTAENPSPFDVILTEKEKLVKPDYLFDPKAIDTLLRREQKICALAMLEVDRIVLSSYGMPTNEADEAISKLLMDINFNVYPEDFIYEKKDISRNVAKFYQACKEIGDLAAFWTFNAQVLNEMEYIIAQNPELYFGKISLDTWHTYNNLWNIYLEAACELKDKDPEMAKLNELLYRDYVYYEGYTIDVFDELETAVSFYQKAKDQFVFRRNNMLTY